MALRFGRNDRVRIDKIEVLSDQAYVLRRISFDWRRRDGGEQRQTREVYDRGDGAVALLYRRGDGSVVLTRQFRLPAFCNGHDGMLVEAAAGLLDEADPDGTIIKEIEEETGYRVATVTKVMECFMSPGAVTERLHFYLAAIDAAERTGKGGGLQGEGEDIDVVECSLDEALDMIRTGAIMDAKTIMLLQHLALNRNELLDV